MVVSTGIWYRLTNNPQLDCPNLHLLWRVPGPRQRLGSGLMHKNGLFKSQGVPSEQRSSALILSLTVIWVAIGQLELLLQIHWCLEEGKPCWMTFLMCYSLQLHHHHLCHAGWYTSKFFWSVESSFFALNGFDHQLWCWPLLFHNFRLFNIKATVAYHPIIQKEMDDLLAKGSIEASTGGAVFYSNVFVAPKHTSSLWLILNLKLFNHYMHIPTFKVWQLTQHCNYAFSIDLKDAYVHNPIVKHHLCFLHFVWQHKPYQSKVLPIGLAMVPRVFTSLTIPIMFLCRCKGFHVKIYLDDILVWLG